MVKKENTGQLCMEETTKRSGGETKIYKQAVRISRKHKECARTHTGLISCLDGCHSSSTGGHQANAAAQPQP